MINISFDNPYLLLLFIPLILVVVIPFAIAIRKENKSKETTAALICHLLIVALTVPALAGMVNTSIITETELYVLADVSHSSHEQLSEIDAHITDLGKQLPRNSKMGVITFGKDAVLHTPMGGRFTTVADHTADDSATDILGALKYADSLFRADTIQRVVLYTDGLSTDPDATNGLLQTVKDMKERGIYIDVVYINANLAPDTKEMQISQVDFNPSTYLNRQTSADILIESTTEAEIYARLLKNGSPYLEKAITLTPGYNIVNFDLYTEEAGENDYTLSIIPQQDTSSHNNTYSFTQTVNETVHVLVLTDRKEEEAAIRTLYGEGAVLDVRVKPDPEKPSSSNNNRPKPVPFDVPYTVEELCKYDEFVLSNVNVDEINHAESFVHSLDICVSMFGKSLITVGDNNLQISETAAVQQLNNMLPVKFGNQDQDPKLYAIVIDSSRSMEFRNFDFFRMAKSAGKYLLSFLNENDYFMVVNFSGEVYVPVTPCKANPTNIQAAVDKIDALTVTQGTMIGRTLDRVLEMMTPYTTFQEKQVMLISDGMSFEGGETTLVDNPVASAMKLRENNITVSALNAGNTLTEGESTMKNIAAAGGGKYYFAKSSSDLVGVMFQQIADDVNQTRIEGRTEVQVGLQNDPVLAEVQGLPDVFGYLYARTKASAENVLLVQYKKASGTTVQAPLYAYWSYGNGRVATLTTDLAGAWVTDWQEGAGLTFLQNIKTTNIPKTRIDCPYTTETHFDGKHLHVDILPAVLNPDATMTVKLTLPDGSVSEKKLTFDSYRYFHKFEVDAPGKYRIDITYDWITKSYTSSSVFHISYSPEYDMFQTYSPAALHAFMRNNGTVTETGNVKLQIDESRMDTYVLHFTVPFLALAAALYVIDTVIRKLKWADIKSFFKKRRKGAIK